MQEHAVFWQSRFSHNSSRPTANLHSCDSRLLYLPLYAPNLNPIEEFFNELEAYIKKAWPSSEENPDQVSHAFLRQYVHDVGAKQQSAKSPFDI